MNYSLEEQIKQLISKYSKLCYSKCNDEYIVQGNFEFKAKNPDNNVSLIDDYDIKIAISNTYPNSLPRVFETAGKINQKEYAHYLDDKSLCLGVSSEIHERFTKNRTLLYFVETFVVDYLYAYSYYKKYGVRIFGERLHGIAGIIQFYYEKFNVKTEKEVLLILDYICSKSYRGHILCPCGSGKIIRKCEHNKVLFESINSGLKKYYLDDLLYLKKCGGIK